MNTYTILAGSNNDITNIINECLEDVDKLKSIHLGSEFNWDKFLTYKESIYEWLRIFMDNSNDYTVTLFEYDVSDMSENLWVNAFEESEVLAEKIGIDTDELLMFHKVLTGIGAIIIENSRDYNSTVIVERYV